MPYAADMDTPGNEKLPDHVKTLGSGRLQGCKLKRVRRGVTVLLYASCPISHV